MTTTGVDVRRARASDAAALVRLRARMLETMGTDVGDDGAAWRDAAHAYFVRRLGEPAAFAAYVVDDAELGVVSCAVGVCETSAPSPLNPDGRHGHVWNVCTDPRRLRRGYARACLAAVLGWFRDETGASAVDLHATGDGIELYRSLGFADPAYPSLRLSLPRGRPASVTG